MTPTLVTRGPRAQSPARPKPDRLFYSGAAVILLVLMLLGFQRYYLHGRGTPDREIAPPAKALVLLHATAMTAWVALAVVQPLLIAGGRRRVHMALGRVGAALAACVVALGLVVAVVSARNTPPEARIWTLTPRQFLAIPVATVVLFGVFVAVGVRYRFRPEVHRPMMLTATLFAIPAAVSRIEPLSALYAGTAWEAVVGPFLWTMVLAAGLLAVKCLLARSFDRWLALGCAALAAAFLSLMPFARTGAWDRCAGMLL